MHYIADKFGFVSSFYETTDLAGTRVTKIRHCMDLREAQPFKTRGEAEAAYKRTYMGTWWHCVVSSMGDKDNYPGHEAGGLR